MPLKTKTVDLRDARDRLDDELDELAEREASLRHELEGLDDSDESEAEAQRIGREIQDIQEEAQQTTTHLTGIAVTIDEYGERVATDGGMDTAPGGESESDDLARAREEMQSDDSTVVAEQPHRDEQGNPIGGATNDTGANPSEGTTGPASSNHNPEGSDAESGSQNAGALEVTFGGLTAGEYALAADTAEASQRGRIGFAQQGANEAETRNIFVAAGTHNAPYLSAGMGLDDKADAIADLSPDYVRWCEQQVMELTSPPEAVKNGYSSRVESILEEKRNSTESQT